MNKKLLSLTVVLSTALLNACSVNINTKPVQNLTARDAIELSEAAAPEGVSGIYSLLIKQHGYQRDTLYLNTQSDYRDRRNVSLAVPKQVQEQFIELHKKTIEQAVLNKSILVYGKAHREKIWFFKQGKRSEKYYFQTHINITDATQIKLDW